MKLWIEPNYSALNPNCSNGIESIVNSDTILNLPDGLTIIGGVVTREVIEDWEFVGVSIVEEDGDPTMVTTQHNN